MNEPRDDRRVVMRYKPAPRSVWGWAREAGVLAMGRMEAAAGRLRGVRLQRGWWVGPTGVAMLGLAAWVAFGPASVGTRPTGLGPQPAEGRGIDLSTGLPPEVAFGQDEGAAEEPRPLVIDLRDAAAVSEPTREAGAETDRPAEPKPAVAVAETRGKATTVPDSPEPAQAARADPARVTEDPAVAPIELGAAAGKQPPAAAMATKPAEPAAFTSITAPTGLEIDAGGAVDGLEPIKPSPSAATPAKARAESAGRSLTPSAAVATEAVALAKPVPPAPPAESRTQRVVYMVDLSGSLVDSLPEAVRWIGEALDALDQPAVFTVLFFREGEVIEAPPYGLKPATFAMKWEAYDWMRPEQGHVEAGGKATLSDAVLAALRYEVDRVVLLSDDGFGRGLTWAGGPTLLDEIAMTLPNATTRIDTVQFFYRDRAGAMEAIADRFGGDYTFIGVALPDDDPDFVDLYGKLRTR